MFSEAVAEYTIAVQDGQLMSEMDGESERWFTPTGDGMAAMLTSQRLTKFTDCPFGINPYCPNL